MAADEFYISFDTEANPGKLEAIKVTVENVTITDMEQKLNIALCEHPLYRDLQSYVLNNLI